MIDKIPCIEEKCLSYPACTNKTEILCPKLNTLLCYMEESMDPILMWKFLWVYFPKLQTVYKDEAAKTIKNLYGLRIF